MNQIYTYPDCPDYSYEEFSIRKKNGTLRSICAPSDALKAYQQSCLPNLYAEFEAYNRLMRVSECFHGFRPHHNPVTAANRHIGFRTTIVMDIVNFFDSVPMLRHPYQNSYFFKENGYLAQGFPTSPILANFYIVPMIVELKQLLQEQVGEFALTIYADDIQISINQEDYATTEIIKFLVTELLTKYDLQIHPHKTRIRYAKHGYRKILGIMVGETDIKINRKVKHKIRAARHQATTLTGAEQSHAACSLGGLVNYAQLNQPS